jgi:outer membrane protein assembly complex protein YaeT
MRCMRRILPVLFLSVAGLTGSACREDGSITVRSITFNGVESVDVSLLKNALATREDKKIPLVGWRLPWAKQRNFFDRSRFDADLKRIEAFYADRGFPDARVTSFDVDLNEKQDSVAVVLNISEGAPVRVVAVELRGFDVIPSNHYATLEKRLPLRVGEPRDRQKVVAAREMALNELRDHGYPYSRVLTEENDGPGGKEARVVFTADPGTLAHFGPVEIVGQRSVSEGVIRQQITFKLGDLYRRSDIQETQRRLYALELFQFVNIESLDPERQSPEVRTRLTVAEGKHQRMNGGIGYGTEEKFRVDGEYKHVNFLGGARSAGAHARWSGFDKGVRLDFVQPSFLLPGFTLGVDGQIWTTDTPAYNSTVTGARIAYGHRSSARTSWSVSLASERSVTEVNSDVITDPAAFNGLIALGIDPLTSQQKGTLSPLAFDFQRSTADDRLNARRGYQIAFHAEDAGRLLPGTFHYYGVSGDARHYLSLEPRIVLANRLLFGNLEARLNDPSQVPFSKRYFLGGATSLRGWGRYEVSPLSAGLPVGGQTMLAFTSEARIALRGQLSSVLFLDAGNVWPNRSEIDLADIRYDVGAGLRYRTPVGPVRFDFGYQLNPIPGLLVNNQPQLRRWRVHFSIGQAF